MTAPAGSRASSAAGSTGAGMVLTTASNPGSSRGQRGKRRGAAAAAAGSGALVSRAGPATVTRPPSAASRFATALAHPAIPQHKERAFPDGAVPQLQQQAQAAFGCRHCVQPGQRRLFVIVVKLHAPLPPHSRAAPAPHGPQRPARPGRAAASGRHAFRLGFGRRHRQQQVGRFGGAGQAAARCSPAARSAAAAAFWRGSAPTTQKTMAMPSTSPVLGHPMPGRPPT